MHSVTSSNIAAIGYDAKTSTLQVLFKASGLYEYSGVPRDEYERIEQATSKGREFAARIKGKFPVRKVDVQAAGLRIEPLAASPMQEPA